MVDSYFGISGFEKCIKSEVVECIFSLKWICLTHLLLSFLSWLCWPGVLNKDCSVWVDAARTANVCIPPSFLGMRSCSSVAYLTPKSCLQVKKIAKFSKIALKNQRKSLKSSLLVTVSFWQIKFVVFTSPTNLVFRTLTAKRKLLLRMRNKTESENDTKLKLQKNIMI